MASRKVDYALAVRSSLSAFADLAEKLTLLADMFTDSGYQSGGSNEIVADDLVGHDITLADLAAAKTFAGQLDAFLDNGTPAQFDYRGAINAVRTMP
jgi:hypothetical protein